MAHILTCDCSRLSEYRDDILQAFISSCMRLDGNDQVIDLVVKVMLGEEVYCPLQLIILLSQMRLLSLWSLWHRFFLITLRDTICTNLLSAIQVILKLIKLVLSSSHLLWLRCYKIIHYKIEGDMVIEN